MGEFTSSGFEHQNTANNDGNISKSGIDVEDGYQTDVEGLKADGMVKKGVEEYPLFNVTPEEFFNNQKADRKKIRFKNDSKVTEYIKKTRNAGRPFYIKTKANNGVKYTRRIR